MEEARDPYNTDSSFFADVTNNPADPNYSPFFIYIQTARNAGLTKFLGDGTSPSTPADQNAQLHGSEGTKPNFFPNNNVLRKEMAAFIINSQMDTYAITHFLTNTPGGTGTSSFADVPPGGGNGVTAPQQLAIEVMYRRGYTRGCGNTDDGTLKFCPNDNTTRGQMAVFVIRAKLNNVFPTVFSGCPIPISGVPTCGTGSSGDNFGLFLNTVPYFPADTPTSHPFFSYIQKMREMRITTGQTNTMYGSGYVPPYAATDLLTRGQMATFIVRSFFL
jgi:hypothetical protein